jgi:hypothetical protein
MYAPVSLLTLPVVWLALVLAGYMGALWALGAGGWRRAFEVSGSSLFTLGFAEPAHGRLVPLVFSESALGISLLALLITYLPSMYATFSRREQQVALLEVRAGSPPTAAAMIARFHAIEWIERLEDVWRSWEAWFVDLQETHTSFPVLAFFRSPHPNHSWVTAAGAVLDAASLSASTLEGKRRPEAELCVRAGYVSLRHIADYFGIRYNPDPRPDDPISVRREEYDAVYDRLAAAGVPLKTDRERAWRDFAGWRVNYDTVLVALAGLVMAPSAPWSSDRADEWGHTPPLTARAARRRSR